MYGVDVRLEQEHLHVQVEVKRVSECVCVCGSSEVPRVDGWSSMRARYGSFALIQDLSWRKGEMTPAKE